MSNDPIHVNFDLPSVQSAAAVSLFCRLLCDSDPPSDLRQGRGQPLGLDHRSHSAFYSL
jgi:hypothetical protein